ncbi:hypothetical protein KCP75_04820 [Salmonella enterica subsp. enterica]|nr:hypothetical protein KCP75_04820 [Salmonella enterica subsp. enterica]
MRRGAVSTLASQKPLSSSFYAGLGRRLSLMIHARRCLTITAQPADGKLNTLKLTLVNFAVTTLYCEQLDHDAGKIVQKYPDVALFIRPFKGREFHTGGAYCADHGAASIHQQFLALRLMQRRVCRHG